MRTVHTRHEQGAAYMALGAALATGKPQAYAVVPGPGLLNTGAALLTAYSHECAGAGADRADPAKPTIGRELGHLHEIRDQAGIIARLVDHSRAHPARRRRAAPGRRGACSAMCTGRPGPGGARMRDRCVGQAASR